MNELYYILGLIFVFFLGLFLRKFLPSYFNEKGKNLATKEDIGRITEEIESVRLKYNSELEAAKITLQRSLEELKTDLNYQSQLIAKKREVYDELIKSLSVFFGSRDSEEVKKKFLDEYARFWLWAPDNVIEAFNAYIDINIILAGQEKAVIGEKSIDAFNNLLFELRKDAGHRDTKVSRDGFRRMAF